MALQLSHASPQNAAASLSPSQYPLFVMERLAADDIAAAPFAQLVRGL
jgi:hypothetical protein